MDKQEGFSTNKAPLFDGSNYDFWIMRMRTYLKDLGFDIWRSVETGYTTPTTPPIIQLERILVRTMPKPSYLE